MKKDKIYELKIEEDDELSGVDQISLVDEPAIMINWLAFNKVKPEYFHIPDGEDEIYLQHLISKAENEQDLLDNGWVVESIEIVDKDNFYNIKVPTPNDSSAGDEEEYKVRYKYILNPAAGTEPIIATTREFCRELLRKNYVWRIEDMEATTNDTNPKYGSNQAWLWRGGFNCRHIWARIKYRNDARIINKASVNTGKVMVDGFPNDITPDIPRQPKTVVEKHPSFSAAKQFEVGVPHYTKDGKLYEGPTHKGPDGRLMTGAVHTEDSEPLYHKDEISEKFESTNDYPESASNNACKVLRWRDEHPDEIQGMTQIGWIRANQLCNKENISRETIGRMAAFERHRQNAEVAPEFKDTPWKDAGYVAWLGWGGTSGIEWAKSKVESFGYDVSTIGGYQDPNIKKKKKKEKKFQIENEDKRIIVGPAMVPDLRIPRVDANGNKYEVYFSADTIRMIAEKYMRKKYLDNNDEMHNGEAVKDVYVMESWIKETEEDKSNKYGFQDTPIGTWFVMMRVKNDEVWQKIKAGDLRGFSVSGYFEEIAAFCREEMFLQRLADLLKEY